MIRTRVKITTSHENCFKDNENTKHQKDNVKPFIKVMIMYVCRVQRKTCLLFNSNFVLPSNKQLFWCVICALQAIVNSVLAEFYWFAIIFYIYKKTGTIPLYHSSSAMSWAMVLLSMLFFLSLGQDNIRSPKGLMINTLKQWL